MRSSIPSLAILILGLLGSILVNALVIHSPEEGGLQVHDADVSWGTVPEVAYSARSADVVARGRVKKPTKTKPKKTPSKTNPKPPTTPKPSPTPKPKLEDWQKPVPAQSSIDRMCKVPKNKALFWSGTSDKVHTYRDEAGRVTDGTAYPRGYTWRYRNANGSYRDEKKGRLFAKRFSIAFAKKASGEVHLMVPWETGPKPGQYFHKYEWPILKKSLARGKVTKIIQVNPNNFKETREYDPKQFGLSKRTAAIDLDNVPWNVDLNALAEKWRQVHGEQD